MSKNFLFIDRDGTLIKEPLHTLQIDKIEKLKLESNVIPALIELKKHKYKFLIVTNQDGLGTNSFPILDFDLSNNFMLNLFESQGIVFEKIFICPHFKNQKCNCRKPNTKLVDNFIKNNKINTKLSYVIGDRITDLLFAKNIGIQGIRYGKYGYNWLEILKFILKRYRYAKLFRNTLETKVHIEAWLDYPGHSHIDTKINFFNHMLHQISIHSGITMNINVFGDVYIDDHHTVEDTAIVLGKVLNKILKDKIGINRFSFLLPMDESIAKCIIDISGRPYLKFKANFKYQKVGDLSTEMIKHFFYTIVYSMNINLHLEAKGENDHHIAESLFKVFGKCLQQSIKLQGNVLPSSKGII
ncbi:bifunctional histidinol-phosphatase/imidazoleglycerol-phosphate dehydratase HisB [Buchnera aphidicola (Neophyllaphis podocarpi)]|uniref:bifunctional histidinol-phosphatase/imidazoleglycerol-phosphate dehydratase HisB n=1 Tax=Buchnera aphidicola TaxID=9 RepID=UPI0031B865C9